MRTYWSHFGCEKQDEETLVRLWHGIERRISSRIASLSDPLDEVHLAVYHQEEAPAWQIQATIPISPEPAVARATDNDVRQALESVTDDLLAQVDTLTDSLATGSRRPRRSDDLIPLLERAHKREQSDVFFTWIQPLVASLRGAVEHELRWFQVESDVTSGQPTTDDLLNETLLRAYDEFPRRPPRLALRLWLLDLAVCALDDAKRWPVTQSLDDRVEKPSEEPDDSQRTSWVEWPTLTETIDLGDMLPEIPSQDRWDSLDFEAKSQWTDRLLARLPRMQRQALVLHTVHGYTPAEIADFQRRSVDDVQLEIDEGRRSIEQFYRDEYLVDVESRMASSSEHTTRRT